MFQAGFYDLLLDQFWSCQHWHQNAANYRNRRRAIWGSAKVVTCKCQEFLQTQQSSSWTTDISLSQHFALPFQEAYPLFLCLMLIFLAFASIVLSWSRVAFNLRFAAPVIALNLCTLFLTPSLNLSSSFSCQATFGSIFPPCPSTQSQTSQNSGAKIDRK